MCLYCNERCHAFNSLEAVRKHMVAKSHCKVHYGDGGEDEEAELEEFYDYSSRFHFITILLIAFDLIFFLIIKHCSAYATCVVLYIRIYISSTNCAGFIMS